MRVGRLKSGNNALYLIVFLVIIVAFLLLGGATWLKGAMHGGGSASLAGLNWIQILIGLGIGFLAGYLVARRRW